MTEQPPSAFNLRGWLWDNMLFHRNSSQVSGFVDEAMEHINAYADRVCEQRVSAEAERAEAARLFLRALFVDLDADLKPLCRRLIEAYRAPAERRPGRRGERGGRCGHNRRR